jgi:uncharacterized membrane protein
MKNQRMTLLAALSAVSFIGIAVAYFFLPASIPIHWGVNGKIDGWGHRANILWMGALPLAMVLLSRFLPKIDPRSEAYERHKKAYAVIITSITIFFIAIGWLTVAVSLGVPIDMSDWIRGGIGLLFIGMGNFMSQLKRNFFIGIRTPWALADDEVWRRTHRRGAWVFVIMGLAYLASVALPEGPILYVLFIAMGAGIVYIYVYSYLVHRSLKAERLNADASGQGPGAGTGDSVKGGQA